MMSQGFRARGSFLRGFTVGLLLPLGCFLLNGPLAASLAHASSSRRSALEARARLQGIDAELLLHPQAWAKRQQDAAEKQRKAVLASLPLAKAPAWLQSAAQKVEQVQAIHSLAAVLAEGKAAEPHAISRLSPEAQALYKQARQARLSGPKRQRAAGATRIRTALALVETAPVPEDGVEGTSPETAPREPVARAEIVTVPIAQPEPADTLPTPDAQSTDPIIVAKAKGLGHDVIRIFNFVHDTIETELYFGSKKGAVGALREGRANDVDQASLLIALLRASGIPSKYETGTVELSASAVNVFTGTESLSASLTALLSSGVQAKAVYLGKGVGLGIQLAHTWVRAFVPSTAYRGIQESTTQSSWVHLGPSLKRVTTQKAADIRDKVTFDFQQYLSQPTGDAPSKVYEGKVREYVLTTGLECDGVDGATKRRSILADRLPLLPAELPARRVASDGTLASLTATVRHQLRFTGRTSSGLAYTYQAPMVSLWGKSVTVVYDPATPEDAAKIQAAGGIESTPAYSVKLKPVLKVDGSAVSAGAGETPGAEQSMLVEMVPPKTEARSATYSMTVGGIYAFALAPGLVPADLITEREARVDGLAGDNREAEKLNVIGLSYFRQLQLGRERMAALQWHRLFKDIEVAQASVEPQLASVGTTPVRLARSFFVFDAAQTGFGTFSVDGDHHRSSYLFKLVGFESSFLEHRISEQYKGAPSHSAVSVVQQAGPNTITFDSATVDEALLRINVPLELLERLRELADQGYTIVAPLNAYDASGLGSLYGFVATSATSGIYEINFRGQPLNGGVGANVSPPATSASGGGTCSSCGGGSPTGSEVNLLSGNYFDQIATLSQPSRGVPLSVVMTYSSLLGWHHSYDRKVEPQADGSLVFTDGEGVRWRFSAGSASGTWNPPPTRFQRVQAVAGGGYDMTFPDGLRHRYDATGRLAYERDTNGHQIDVVRDPGGRIQSVLGTATHALGFGYDSDGRLASIQDSTGRALGFAYEGGRLTTYTDVLGHSRTFTYDSNGRMRTKSDFLGNITRIDYDDLGRAIRVEDPEGGVYKYAYDTRNRTVVHTDRLGQVHLFEIGDVGLPVRTVDPLGNETRTVYDPRGNRLQQRDARGHWTSSTYYDDGNLKTHTDALGNTTKYTYAELARLETVTDANDKVTTVNRYDTAGNLVESKDALGNATTYTYEDGLPKTITRPGGSTTVMSYDSWGNVESMVDATNGTTTMTYDPAGHLATMTDANNKTRILTSDAKGRMVEMKDAQLRPTAFTYDDNGNRLTVVAPGNVQTSFEYDRLGRLVKTTDALDGVATQEYDAAGHVVARTDARGARTTMSYDALGRLISTTDPVGGTTTMGFCANEAQQPCLIVDALGNVTTVVEDELGRETERRDPLGNTTRTLYDRLGRREAVIDPAGNSTTFVYDDAGRLTSVIDALHGVTSYGYDGRGNRTTVTDANNHTTTFEYDLSNRLAQEVVPDHIMATQYGYDLAGNRTTKLDGKNQPTAFAYDANRRLTDITYAAGVPAHFEYDERGNKILERNGDSERRLTYDALGRLTDVNDVTVGHDIEYTYDAAGNRTSMTVKPENETTRYFWDMRGLLSSMIDPDGGTYRFGYDRAGRRTTVTYPNDMVLSTTYDAASRVVSMVYTAKSKTVIESFTYTYDTRGNRLSKIFAGGSAEEYGYDELSRLVRVTYPSGRTVQYTYDAVGNRIQMVDGQVSNTGPVCTGDADCDGVVDNLDNCPQARNPEQTDSDRGAAPASLRYGFLFEEPSGSVVQDAEKRFTANIQGSVTRVAGHSGRALRFTGARNAAVVVPHSPATDITGNTVTISAWVKPAGTSSGAIVMKAGQYGIYHGGGPYGFKFIKPGATFLGQQRSMTVGVWAHILVTWDGTKARYYLNGNLAATETLSSTPIVSTTNPVLIGCTVNSDATGTACNTYGSVNATIDDVGVWDRVLSIDEILALFRGSLLEEDRQGDACDACPASRDSGCAPTTCLDEDGDGYGVPGASNCAAGRSDIFDCDDHATGVHPGAAESCDGVDNNCNGLVDDACLLAPKTTKYHYNGFNQLVKSGVPLACLGNDADCDGLVDSQDNCPAVTNPGQEDSDVIDMVATGPVALWQFEDAAGSASAADSMGSYPASLVNGATRAASNFVGLGQALSLGGTNQHATVPATLSTKVGNNLTVEAWVYSNTITSSAYRGIVSEAYAGDGNVQFELFLDGTPSRLSAGFFGGSWYQTGESTAFPLNQWVHVAASYDGQKIRVYRGGVKVAESAALNRSLPVGTSGWRIGARHDSIYSSTVWNGKLDNVAIYARTLPEAEIAAHAALHDGIGDACDPCPDSGDPACRPTTCTDEDGDGYGVQGASNCAAGRPELFDCNDSAASVHPGAVDVQWDGVDNDCNGYPDEPMQDLVTYQWDGNGNMVGDGREWDARDRLVSGGFGYDTGNLRVKMGTQKVLLDGIEEAREYGVEAKRYDHDPSRVDGPLAQKTSAGKGYFVTDALGSVYGVVDGSGAVVSRYGYDVYGARTASGEGMATAWGFTGRRHDGEGEMYYRARYRDVGNGGWMAVDPKQHNGPVGQHNAYQYAYESPAALFDPSGEIVIAVNREHRFFSHDAGTGTRREYVFEPPPVEHYGLLFVAIARVELATMNRECKEAFLGCGQRPGLGRDPAAFVFRRTTLYADRTMTAYGRAEPKTPASEHPGYFAIAYGAAAVRRASNPSLTAFADPVHTADLLMNSHQMALTILHEMAHVAGATGDNVWSPENLKHPLEAEGVARRCMGIPLN